MSVLMTSGGFWGVGKRQFDSNDLAKIFILTCDFVLEI